MSCPYSRGLEELMLCNVRSPCDRTPPSLNQGGARGTGEECDRLVTEPPQPPLNQGGARQEDKSMIAL